MVDFPPANFLITDDLASLSFTKVKKSRRELVTKIVGTTVFRLQWTTSRCLPEGSLNWHFCLMSAADIFLIPVDFMLIGSLRFQ